MARHTRLSLELLEERSMPAADMFAPTVPYRAAVRPVVAPMTSKEKKTLAPARTPENKPRFSESDLFAATDFLFENDLFGDEASED